MSNSGSRLLLTLACVLGILAGCKSVPPVPEGAKTGPVAESNEHEGWLWKSATGGNKPADTPPAAPRSVAGPATSASAPTGAVVAASANLSGPQIPGMPNVSATGTSQPPAGPALNPAAPDVSSAGPPPTIPAELPAVTRRGVSIDKKEKEKEEEEKKGFQLSDLAPENIYKNVKKAAGYGPDEKIAHAAKEEGNALFGAKKYKEAAAKYAVAADRWPDSPLEEDALFLKGESEFFSDQYPKAHDTFGGLLKKYANTRHLDTVIVREFDLGRYWEQLHDAKPMWPVTPNVTDGSRPMFDTFGYAVQAYERVRQYDPTGPWADASLMALGNAYLLRGQFEDAARHYDMLRKEYPNSKYQMWAHVFGLQAHMRKYQGTWYDGAPLNDATKIADQALAQFGDRLGDERERVIQARAQIVEEKANREFTVAQYYDNLKKYRAARIYYTSLVNEYPSTQRAKEAKTRLEQIRNEPDLPPNHFKWLTGIFESEKK